MGQGAESCGGYDIEYDPYDENESQGFSVWQGKGFEYDVCKMSDDHIRNAIALCGRMSATSSFSCDS